MRTETLKKTYAPIWDEEFTAYVHKLHNLYHVYSIFYLCVLKTVNRQSLSLLGFVSRLLILGSILSHGFSSGFWNNV